MPYPMNIDENFLEREYPQLRGTTYLDHAGSQIPARSLIDAHAEDLRSSLYGNPHSEHTPSKFASERIEEIRLQTLEFFHADPEDYSLIFVANASAALKLVGECFHDHAMAEQQNKSSWFGRRREAQFPFAYHRECHNSVVGIREYAKSESRCFMSDTDVEAWIDRGLPKGAKVETALFAYPGQSNFNGRRLPLSWPRRIRDVFGDKVFTLLDAAALASTCPVNLDEISPDFMVTSFYKIFGYPNLGAVLVHKRAAHIMRSKRYFAGGTVDMVSVLGDTWHAKKHNLHEQLEEGTLPFHNILALGQAIHTHQQLYGGMHAISARLSELSLYAFVRLAALHHSNGSRVVQIYKDSDDVSRYGDSMTQGATIAFNVLRPDGSYVFWQEVERTADSHHIYVRSGAMCNPGGFSRYLDWDDALLREAFEEGFRCSKPLETFRGKATGVVRLSLGACSIKADIDRFIDFLQQTYVNQMPLPYLAEPSPKAYIETPPYVGQKIEFSETIVSKPGKSDHNMG